MKKISKLEKVVSAVVKEEREFVDAFYLEANDEFLLDELKEKDNDLYVVDEIDEFEAAEMLRNKFEDDDYDYSGNMPCDNSGYCSGTTCSRYYECN